MATCDRSTAATRAASRWSRIRCSSTRRRPISLPPPRWASTPRRCCSSSGSRGRRSRRTSRPAPSTSDGGETRMTAPDFDSRAADALAADDLVDAWPFLSVEERVEGFRLLPPAEAEHVFLGLSSREQADLVLGLPAAERQLWMRQLAPDDAADLIQQAPEPERAPLLALIDPD